MKFNHMKKLAFTIGDPAGVGPEIITAFLNKHTEWKKKCVLIGSNAFVKDIPDVESVTVGERDFSVIPGRPSEAGAKIAWDAMKVAADGCIQGKFSGVVTGPVSKSWLERVGYPFPGQTEFFASAWNGEPTMGFVGKKLTVVLATWHIPLKDVPKAINEHSLTLAIERADMLGKTLGKESPRIAVCGLNPHAGEDGMLGKEERDLIDPVLNKLRARFPNLSRTLPSDTVFHRHYSGEFDVTVALYHDQGLAPLKLLEFDSAVNVTLGLPYIRTSPDHGTAFDIAGKGVADIGSWEHAVCVAERFANK